MGLSPCSVLSRKPGKDYPDILDGDYHDHLDDNDQDDDHVMIRMVMMNMEIKIICDNAIVAMLQISTFFVTTHLSVMIMVIKL